MQNAPQKTSAKAQKTKVPHYVYGIIILVLAIGLGAGILIGWVITRQNSDEITFKVKAPEVVIDQNAPNPIIIPTETPSSTEITEPEDYRDDYKFIAEEITDEATLNVTWYKNPIELSWDEMLELAQEHTEITEEYIEYLEDFYTVTNREYENIEMWERGVVEGGEYAGSKIYLLKKTVSGMGIYYSYKYVVLSETDSKLYLLVDTENYYPDSLDIYLHPASKIKINKEIMPKELRLSNGTMIYSSASGYWGSQEAGFMYEFEYGNNTPIAKTADGRNVYRLLSPRSDRISGCLLVFSKEGEPYHYASQISGKWFERDYNPESWAPPGYELDITWNQDYQNEDHYLPYLYGGCGGHDCVDIVSDEIVGSMDQLVVAGKTLSGEPIYVPKDPVNHQEVINRYQSWMIYDDEGAKPDIQAFLDEFKAPVFFWKDGFGNWVRYIESSIQPQGECGKPVIYLYPEKDTDIHVELPSFINVTVSDPLYPQNGWDVLAHPNGQLDYSDGNTYGSLFWEGNGVDYQTPATGFVIADGTQEEFLNEILPKYGLNETETKEFIEFWIEEMTGSPYYRLSFLVEEWNEAAPLFVYPKPDTHIRIFMDWEKLDAPISIPEPSITAPERKGFTLVEWGGALWQ